jgi:hypothetical protein
MLDEPLGALVCHPLDQPLGHSRDLVMLITMSMSMSMIIIVIVIMRVILSWTGYPPGPAQQAVLSHATLHTP